jgi:homoserine kinase
MNRRRLVRVPASSANLGPGFDVLAVALSMHVELEVVETGRFAVQTDLRIARDRRNLCVRGFAALADPAAFAFRIKSDIPLSGGLGTSAAAYLAGLMAADSIFELDADVLAHATVLEGHPDNVAAALHGGFVACVDGVVTRLGVPIGLEAVLVVPDEVVRTKLARAALPDQVPLADAVHNVGHVAQLVLGLARADLSLLSHGLSDRLHQPHRAHLYPRSAELVADAQSLGALGATISGAGPTVLVWTAYEATGGVVAALRERCEGWATVMRVPFEENGAQVREL